MGKVHRDYLKEHAPVTFAGLLQDGTLWLYFADINEQAETRLELIIGQKSFSLALKEEFGRGFSEDNLEHARRFY